VGRAACPKNRASYSGGGYREETGFMAASDARNDHDSEPDLTENRARKSSRENRGIGR
jgi:hypothetical protein